MLTLENFKNELKKCINESQINSCLNKNHNTWDITLKKTVSDSPEHLFDKAIDTVLKNRNQFNLKNGKQTVEILEKIQHHLEMAKFINDFCRIHQGTQQTFAQIFAENPKLKVILENSDTSYTDGNTIHVSPGFNNIFTSKYGIQKSCKYMNWKDFSEEDDYHEIAITMICKMLNIHESLHCLYTNFQYHASKTQKTLVSKRIISNIQNIIEDAFIESVVGEDGFENYAELLLWGRACVGFAVQDFNKNKPQRDLSQPLSNSQKIADFLQYFSNKLLFPMVPSNLKTTEEVSQRIALAEPLFIKGKSLRNQYERMTAIPLQIFDIIKDWIEEVEKEQEEQEQLIQMLQQMLQEMMGENPDQNHPNGNRNGNGQTKGLSLSKQCGKSEQSNQQNGQDSNNSSEDSSEQQNSQNQSSQGQGKSSQETSDSKEESNESSNGNGDESSDDTSENKSSEGQSSQDDSSNAKEDNQGQKPDTSSSNTISNQTMREIAKEFRQAINSAIKSYQHSLQKKAQKAIQTVDTKNNPEARDLGVDLDGTYYIKKISFNPLSKMAYQKIVAKNRSLIINYANKLKENVQIIAKTDIARKAKGYKLDTRRLVSPEKCWIKKGISNTMPNFTVSIMVDESGSMQDKMEESIEACTIISEILDRNNVPYAIAGFEGGYTCHIDIIKSFEDNNTKYNIPALCAQGGTPDALGLNWIGLYSDKYTAPNTKQVIIMIADGDGDGTLCTKVYNNLVKQGKTVVVLALQGCYRLLCNQYPEKVVIDCRDIRKMPLLFMKFLSKELSK